MTQPHSAQCISQSKYWQHLDCDVWNESIPGRVTLKVQKKSWEKSMIRQRFCAIRPFCGSVRGIQHMTAFPRLFDGKPNSKCTFASRSVPPMCLLLSHDVGLGVQVPPHIVPQADKEPMGSRRPGIRGHNLHDGCRRRDCILHNVLPKLTPPCVPSHTRCELLVVWGKRKRCVCEVPVARRRWCKLLGA